MSSSRPLADEYVFDDITFDLDDDAASSIASLRGLVARSELLDVRPGGACAVRIASHAPASAAARAAFFRPLPILTGDARPFAGPTAIRSAPPDRVAPAFAEAVERCAEALRIDPAQPPAGDIAPSAGDIAPVDPDPSSALAAAAVRLATSGSGRFDMDAAGYRVLCDLARALTPGGFAWPELVWSGERAIIVPGRRGDRGADCLALSLACAAALAAAGRSCGAVALAKAVSQALDDGVEPIGLRNNRPYTRSLDDAGFYAEIAGRLQPAASASCGRSAKPRLSLVVSRA